MNTFRFLTGLAIAAAVGALSLLILQAEDQPAVISQNPATPEPLVTTVESSAPEPAATSVDSAPARSKMPDVSGVWLYNGEKTVAQFRPAEEA